MAGYAQTEDQEEQVVMRLLRGESTLYDDVWKNQAVQHPDPVTGVLKWGPSWNWIALAQGISAWVGYQPGIDALRFLLSTANDEGGPEGYTDMGHTKHRMVGVYLQTLAFERGNHPEKAWFLHELDLARLQFWSQQFFGNAFSGSPDSALFTTSAQRPVFPEGERGPKEYMWQRGRGKSHTQVRALPGGTGMCNDAERIYDHQEPFTLKEFCDHAEPALRLDVAAIEGAFAARKWDGLKEFLVQGTRGTHEFLRFENGGYAHVLAKSYGIPSCRWAVFCKSEGLPVDQFPNSGVPRQPRDGWGKIDVAAKTVTAHDPLPGLGDWKRPFPESKILIHLRSSKAGLERLDSPVPGTLPPPPSGTSSTIGDLMASTTREVGVGDVYPWNYGAITGLSPIVGHAGHYAVRKGGGSHPWSVEVIYVSRDDGNAYILSETAYRPADGTVYNMRSFWRDLNNPGVLWLPKDLRAGTFWSTGWAVFNNISGTSEGLPYNVPASPVLQTSVVKAESTLSLWSGNPVASIEHGLIRSDRMNENTEEYTFGIDTDGFFPYIHWKSYHNGTLVGEAGGAMKRPLGDGCRVYCMFSDGTEGWAVCNLPIIPPELKQSPRPVIPKPKESGSRWI